ncbi:hypothetical protein [Streptomyces sp. NPDC048192]|uniref:hypothetical protein n=1 Tax=Streptomyces sp. NPDC048192 TaxID=3365510 RepID=UPI00371D6664
MPAARHACPQSCGAYSLVCLWDELLIHCPDPRTAVNFLAARTGIPAGRLHQARRIRNMCAHPARGRATPHQIATAIGIAHQALAALH